MDNVKHSLLLNLSNQANTTQCRRTNLSQFNFITILGYEYLKTRENLEGIPISFDIDKEGNMSINGLDEDLINDNNIYIYKDKKVTKSEDNQ